MATDDKAKIKGHHISHVQCYNDSVHSVSERCSLLHETDRFAALAVQKADTGTYRSSEEIHSTITVSCNNCHFISAVRRVIE